VAINAAQNKRGGRENGIQLCQCGKALLENGVFIKVKGKNHPADSRSSAQLRKHLIQIGSMLKVGTQAVEPTFKGMCVGVYKSRVHPSPLQIYDLCILYVGWRAGKKLNYSAGIYQHG
jgi:hypothetical protein